jgi:OOP family OmpA-OmpF porin
LLFNIEYDSVVPFKKEQRALVKDFLVFIIYQKNAGGNQMLKKNRVSLYLLALSFLVSMAFTVLVHAGSQDLSMKLKSGQYIQNANNFYIIFDKTGSMGNFYAGQLKLNIEKSLVSSFNRTIPDLSLMAGLRTFGSNYRDFDVTKFVYGIVKYNPDSLDAVIQKLKCPFGDSPLDVPITAAGNDLRSVQGRIALVIFSDGEDMGNAPVKAATSVKSQYGDNLCIYTVQIGNDENGGKLLDQIARAGGCGFSVKGDKLGSDAEMTNFVERIFLASKPAMPPPRPAKVEKKEVMQEAAVQREAPASKEVSMELLVEFDTGMAAVKPKYNNEIKKVADFMKEYPDTTAIIEGHTDNVGKEAANVKLSQRRADSIKAYLVKKFGIDSSRIKAVGYGPNKPVASNATKEGKQKNRRVKAVFSNITK